MGGGEVVEPPEIFHLPPGEDVPYNMNPAIRRKIMWDIIPHSFILGQEHADSWGVSVSSEDVLEMEHIDAHEREDYVAPIVPVLAVIGSMVGDVIARAMLVSTKNEITPEAAAAFTEQVQSNVIVGSRAVLMELLDLGVIGMNQDLEINS
jgi:hypothetical protein